jgi:integrase
VRLASRSHCQLVSAFLTVVGLDRRNMHALRLHNAPEPTSIQDVIDLFLEHLRARVTAGEYSPRALDNRARLLRDFAVEAGRQPVHQARQFLFSAWLTGQAGRWSKRTREDAAATVVQCFKWAADQELIERCPFRKPPIPGTRRTKPAFLHGELRAMRCAMESRAARWPDDVKAFRRALYFLWHTGARSGEMRELRWTQIDWVSGVARLEDHKTRHHTGEDRLIPLNRSLLRLLRAMFQVRTSEYVFTSRGKPWLGTRGKDAFGLLFKRWAARAGLPRGITPHSLRHGYCVRCIEAGLSDRATADQGGWRKTAMVSHYGAAARSRCAHLSQDAEAVRRARPQR